MDTLKLHTRNYIKERQHLILSGDTYKLITYKQKAGIRGYWMEFGTFDGKNFYRQGEKLLKYTGRFSQKTFEKIIKENE